MISSPILWLKWRPSILARSSRAGGMSSAADIEPIVDEVLAANPKVVEDLRAGKEAALQFLIGQGMRLSKGAANPAQLKEVITKRVLTD